MGKVTIGSGEKQSVKTSVEQTVEPVVEIKYVDRIVEVEKEKIVYVDKPVEVVIEKPVDRIIVEYKTVEVPVMYETIKEIPVYIEKEVIKEVLPKVIDITDHLTVKKNEKKIKTLKVFLLLSVITNLFLMVV